MCTKVAQMNQESLRTFIVLLPLVLAACSGGGGDGAGASPVIRVPAPVSMPADPVVSVDVGLKQLIFSWPAVSGATHYRLLENLDGHSGFTQLGDDIPGGTLVVRRPIAVHQYNFADALYIVQACNTVGCSDSTEVNAIHGALDAIGYFKASNTDPGDKFGESLALSADGKTLAVGTIFEGSAAIGINGAQNDNRAAGTGAVYVFRFDGMNWSQQAYLKASNNSGKIDFFGGAVALSADGSTLAVGAIGEESGATGINGDQYDFDYSEYSGAGAVYLFRFDDTRWFQQAYIKASNTHRNTKFGSTVALSSDGNTLAVGSDGESGSGAGINDDQTRGIASTGAVYLFRSDGASWWQQAYIKASNPDRLDHFGEAVALSSDGNTLAVGTTKEDSAATGIDGDQHDNSVNEAGAVYIFRFKGDSWFQQAYVKASNTDANRTPFGDKFGVHVALSGDGHTLVVGADRESSDATGVGGDQHNDLAEKAGAVYVFRFDGAHWSQQAYIKASNTGEFDGFGRAFALNDDGDTLVVGAFNEGSAANGIGGDQTDSSCGAGAAYLFRFDGNAWTQRAYIKAPNNNCGGVLGGDHFGHSVTLSSDGEILAIGAILEDGDATGIGGDQTDNSAIDSGAVYLY